MKKIFQFLANSAKELSGQPSSKRVIAYWGAFLINNIVCAILFVMINAAVRDIEIKDSLLNLIYFVGGAVLVSVIGYVLTILGYNMSQNKAAISKGLVNVESKILPEPPKPAANEPA